MIIAVGFKVNSERAVQFRKWVNQIAKDYTIKGWVMDDERLKRGTYLTEKYFDEQLERIREIRASERKFYQKITDLYATAIDYDKNSATTRRFYATVQNKMHYAVHGHTAAELIVERADHTREHMGLTTWADAPEGKIKKSDVTVAKNYLSQDEMKQLNRMVEVIKVMDLTNVPIHMKEIMFAKVKKLSNTDKAEVFRIAQVFHVETADIGVDSVLLECKLTERRNNELIELLKQRFQSVEIVRGGAVAIESIATSCR